ncbi:MAG TPA: PQQ-dependent sugar dehydrogenase [Candidatus Limnocylindrales bacterium]|nr:PQQ-dependent sugar dehydrogenase [Candidatus Limnocylindrales bacterium]
MARRPIIAAPFLIALLLSLVLPAPAFAVAPRLRTKVVQAGLTNPWDVAFAPAGQMFVTERPGRVKVFQSGGANTPLLANTNLYGVHAAGEAGAMGIAVDPFFNSNRWVYVCVSRDYGGKWLNQVIRYYVTPDWRLQHVKNVIQGGMKANTIHNGCAVEIGPDRKLWVSMGDAGDEALAQDPSSLNGKILRLNRGGGVPSDNPIMPGASKRTIVYSVGHRNPQGIAFHPVKGRVYAIEHGPDRSDEINWIRPGRNYGWPCVTGNNAPYHNGYAACATNAPFTPPVWHSGSSTIATSAGAFVSGSKWQGWSRNLFVAQLKEQDLRRFRVSSDGLTATQKAVYFNNKWGRLRAVARGPGQRIWITTSNGSNDKVIRIAPVPR